MITKNHRLDVEQLSVPLKNGVPSECNRPAFEIGFTLAGQRSDNLKGLPELSFQWGQR